MLFAYKLKQEIWILERNYAILQKYHEDGGESVQTFEMLYKEYYERVYAFLYRLSADRSLTEDLTQETFLQAYLSLHRFRGECEIFTWLASIGKHVYFKYLKRNKKYANTMNLDYIVDLYGEKTDDPAEYVHKEYTREAVRKILADIPKKYRDVVLLRIYAELPFSQIASVLKISENSAKVIFFRAKKKMMEVLQHELGL